MDIDEVPIKTVRISFHIFQKDDESENIPDNPAGHDYLDMVLDNMNDDMASLDNFDYTTTSPYFQDSKIRYEVVAIHFWENTEMWSKGDTASPSVWLSNGNDLYDFVMNKPISYKNYSIHLLMPGNYSGDGSTVGGVACDAGCNDWSMAVGSYLWYQNTGGLPNNPNHWDPAINWRHELGHNLGLRHIFSASESCSDTPNCQDCNNNLMDWIKPQSSLTQCQLSIMHHWLENNSAVGKSGLPNYNIEGQVYWPGYSSTLNPVNYVSNSLVHVTLNEPDADLFNWTLSYGSAYWQSDNDGKDLEIDYSGSSGTSMNFEVETEYNCNTISRTVGFEYSGNLYSIHPNPMDNELTISMNDETYNKIVDNSNITNKNGHYLKVYDQYKSLVIEKVLVANFGSRTIEVPGLKPGLYIVELQNPYFKKTFKVQKL